MDPKEVEGYGTMGEPLIDTRRVETVTLRDQFAMAAIPAIIVVCVDDPRNSDESHEQYFARRAYMLADAMMCERAK